MAWDNSIPQSGVLTPPDIRDSNNNDGLNGAGQEDDSLLWRSPETGCTLVPHPDRACAMDEVLQRLKDALHDRYTVEHQIGRGGMSVVYLAKDLRNKRNVALKILRPELTKTIGANRFFREIKIAANLEHPHILPLFDSVEAHTAT